MLVLSRKENERIRIGDSIVITVVRVAKDRVRLGIEAPDDVLVLRDELETERRDPPAPAPAQESPAPRRAPIPRRSLADFRTDFRARGDTGARGDIRARSVSQCPDEESAQENVALADQESEMLDENRESSPLRRFFRW